MGSPGALPTYRPVPTVFSVKLLKQSCAAWPIRRGRQAPHDQPLLAYSALHLSVVRPNPKLLFLHRQSNETIKEKKGSSY